MTKCSQWLHFVLLSSLFVTTFGGCLFPMDWSGRWFQSALGPLTVNATYFESKGECIQKDGDKYIVSDRSGSDLCKKCIAVYKRHDNVIQYKESNCLPYDSLDELCQHIGGDEPLLTMFRVGDAATIPCPFKSPPFKFSYSRGTGDCSVPYSRIDSCTDDSRLLMYFAACPDVVGTESGVEELNCLATWKEGNSFYLVAKIKKELMLSDEESYRCFMYSQKPGSELAYEVAQSADATCSTVFTSTDGSKMMKLTRMESSHEQRCKFPSWVVEHHQWHSLDNAHSYHFSHKNASLRVAREHGPIEMRLVCNLIVHNASSVVLVAHATSGCKNGYICMVFTKRDTGIIQLQQSSEVVQDQSEACIPPFTDAYRMSDPVTLITVSLPVSACPLAGQYVTSGVEAGARAVQPASESDPSCTNNTTLLIGCRSSPKVMTLQTCTPETNTAYHCHGSWSENHTTYVIASPVSRKSTDAKRYCFVLSQDAGHISLHRLTDSCNLGRVMNQLSSTHLLPLNLTLQGSCMDTSASKDSSVIFLPSLLSLVTLLVILNVLR